MHLELNGKYFAYGLDRLNYDTRKVPIYWPTFDSAEQVGQAPRMFPTLAAAAAAATHPELTGQYPLDNKSIDVEHPYTSFIPPETWHPIAALDLICGNHEQSWRQCQDFDLTPEQLTRLRGRVVLVGFDDPPYDIHESVVGEILGPILQANYIEALLDQRYLKPAPRIIQLIISIIWVWTIEVIYKLIVNTFSALFWAIAISVLWIAIVYYWATLQLGFYLALWPPSFLAILIRFFTKIGEKRTALASLADDLPLSSSSRPSLKSVINRMLSERS
jgi:CHASE2 domain